MKENGVGGGGGVDNLAWIFFVFETGLSILS